MAKEKTVKQWIRAMVTYNGGVSMTTRGVKFLGGRVKPITDRKLALYLKSKKQFSVSDEFTEMDVEVPVAETPIARAPVATSRPEVTTESKPKTKTTKTRKTRK